MVELNESEVDRELVRSCCGDPRPVANDTLAVLYARRSDLSVHHPDEQGALDDTPHRVALALLAVSKECIWEIFVRVSSRSTIAASIRSV